MGQFYLPLRGFKCNLDSVFARFYKPIINKKADDKQIARAGKTVTVIVGIISIIVAPFISFAPAGLYQFVQEFNGLYNMPLLVIILFAFYSKKQLLLEQNDNCYPHYFVCAIKSIFERYPFLYVLSLLFFLDILILIVVSKIKPDGEFVLNSFDTKVNIEPWKHTKLVASILVVVVILTYAAFSPIGFAR